MRLLLTTDTVGGVWTFTSELTEQLISRGHSVALVSFGRAPSAPQQAWCSRVHADYPDKFLYHATSIALEWMQENVSCYDDGAAVLLEVARRFEPDLLHSNQFCFGALPLGVPKLITAHSDVLSWAAACRPNGLELPPWLQRYCELVQNGLDGADAFAAPTAWMLNALRERFTVPCPVKVVFNGRTLPQDSANTRRKLQAVSAGRLWDEAKGLSTLLSIRSPMPLLIAGDVEFGASSPPERMIDVELLGALSAEEIVSHFRTSSIYIVTSLYEPFGLAPLEAALCGCAIVARDIPSLHEVWGDAAMYFGDTRALEERLRTFANDPATLHVAQTSALQRAAEFTAARMADGYIALYESLLEGRQSRKEIVFNAA